MDDNLGEKKLVSVKSIINTTHFIFGYHDYVNKRSYNKQYERWDINDQINYERGRHYAAIFGDVIGFKPKIDRKVNEAAIIAAKAMVNKNLML